MVGCRSVGARRTGNAWELDYVGRRTVADSQLLAARECPKVVAEAEAVEAGQSRAQELLQVSGVLFRRRYGVRWNIRAAMEIELWQ
jgi:hypothetical protein